MLPHDKRANDDKPFGKKGKGKDKPPPDKKDSGEEDKERKRRTSLTDSPLTSSSSSTSSTLDSSDEQKSSSSKTAENSTRKSKEDARDQASSSKDVHGPNKTSATAATTEQPEDEKKSKKKRKKNKKKNAGENKDTNAEGAMNFDGNKTSKEDDEMNKSVDRSKSKEAKANESKPSYSTASLYTGTTTVSSTTNKMSFADGLSTDLFSTSSAMSAPLTSVYNQPSRSKNPYLEKQPGENINRLEVDNAYQVMADQNKKIKNYDGRWMNMFHNAVIDGNYEKFVKCLHVIYAVMDGDRTPSLKRMSDLEFMHYVMLGVINHFYDSSENTTILMSLAATRDLMRDCESTNHGYCKIMELILSQLHPTDVNLLLKITTNRTGRTAIHFAATTGQICQMRALLKYDINPDIIDKSGQAPIHQAIERNNLEMVKLLIRYGADPSLCPRERFKHPPRILALANTSNDNELASWLQKRVDSINDVFKNGVDECIRRFWKILENLSDVHFVRASANYEHKIPGHMVIHRTVTLNIRSNLATRCNQPKHLAALFVLPMYFHHDDLAGPTNPQIFRTAFASDLARLEREACPAIPVATITGPNGKMNLTSLVQPQHNGYYYAYSLKNDLVEGQYQVDIQLNYEPFIQDAEQLILVMGVLLCQELDAKERRTMEQLVQQRMLSNFPHVYHIPAYQPKGSVPKIKEKKD